MRILIPVLLSLLLVSGCAQTATNEQVARALRENPQLVFDALKQDKGQLMDILDKAVQEREEAERRGGLEQGLANPLKPELSERRPFLGEAQAPVTIVEYSDFLCGYCAGASATLTELLRRHPGEIRLFFKHYPAKAGSLELAAAFEALGLQNRAAAWRFAQLAFANQRALADGTGKGLAAVLAGLEPGLKIDQARLRKDMAGREVRSRIEADVAEAKAFGVDGTPTFLVNGVPVRGAIGLEDFEELLVLVRAQR